MRARPGRVIAEDGGQSDDDDDEVKAEPAIGLQLTRKSPIFSIVVGTLLVFLTVRLVWLRRSAESPDDIIRQKLAVQKERPGPWHLRKSAAAVTDELGNGGHEWRGSSQNIPVSVQEAIRIQLSDCHAQPSVRPDAAQNGLPQNSLLDGLACVFQALYAQIEGGAEMRPESVQILMKELHLDSSSVFFNIGSGSGRIALQVYLTSNAKQVVGVEAEHSQHKAAENALKALDNADMRTLLPNAKSVIRSDHKAQFFCANFSEVEMSEATAVYAASLFFSKEEMMLLAKKLAQLRDGTRIIMLTKFPFDTYGVRRLPADSPLQALRLRGRTEIPKITSGEENSAFVYEVDRREAWPPKFDGAAAKPEALLAEACQRSHVNRASLERPSLELSEAVFEVIQGLKLVAGDEICEIGSSTGWLLLRLALETQVDHIAGIFEGSAEAVDVASKLRKAVDDLAPGRIPWYRRIDFETAESLESFLTEGSEGIGRPGSDAFSKSCGGATVVVVNGLKNPDATDITDAAQHSATQIDYITSALTALVHRVAAGTIIVVSALSVETADFCVPGLLPLDKTSEGNDLALRVFAVAPREAHLTKLGLPGFGNGLMEAVQNGEGVPRSRLEDMAAIKILDGYKENLEAKVEHRNVRDVFESGPFRRLQWILTGVTFRKGGHMESASDAHQNKGISAKLLAQLYIARFSGGSTSPCACVESNLRMSMDQASGKDLGDLCANNASHLAHIFRSSSSNATNLAQSALEDRSRDQILHIARRRFPSLVK